MFKNDDLIRDIILKDSTWKSTISGPEPVAGPIVDYEKRCGQLEQELADLKVENEAYIKSETTAHKELKKELDNAVSLKNTYHDNWQEAKSTIASQVEVINNLTNRCGKAWRENAELKEELNTAVELLWYIGDYVVKPSSCDCDECNSAYYELTNTVKEFLAKYPRNHGVEDKEDKPKRLGRWGHRQA